MRKTAPLIFSISFLWIATTLHPQFSHAEGGACSLYFRSVFESFTDSWRRVGRDIDQFRHIEGRTQNLQAEQILEGKWDEAQSRSQSESKPFAKTKAEVVAEWESDFLKRTKDRKNYPDSPEFLALKQAKYEVAAEAKGTLAHENAMLETYLTNYRSVKFRVMGHLTSKVPSVTYSARRWWIEKRLKSKNITPEETKLLNQELVRLDFEHGQRFGSIGKMSLGTVPFGADLLGRIQNRFRLTGSTAMTAEELSYRMVVLDNTVWNAFHSYPKDFFKSWFLSWREFHINPMRSQVMHTFAESILRVYHDQRRAFLKGSSEKAFGEIRPEVIREFYQYGFLEASLSRLVAMYKSRALKGSFKTAIEQDPILKREVERLALEVMYVAYPAIVALSAWRGADRYQEHLRAQNEIVQREPIVVKHTLDDVKNDGTLTFPAKKDKTIEQLEKEMDEKTALKTTKEAELLQPGYSQEKIRALRVEIDKLDEEISSLDDQIDEATKKLKESQGASP